MTRALVLGGGGAKGSYEIGVWKALKELNITFDIVVGTSIGALNGALIVQDDYEKAIDIWSKMNVDSIIDQGIDIEFDFELMKEQTFKYHNFLKRLMYQRSLDVKPFIKLIDQSLDEEKLRNSKINYGLCTVNLSKFKPCLISIDEMEVGLVKAYLYASAACFPAFPLGEINNEKYVDGGYYDNLPIQLASKMGGTEFICVDLSNRPNDKEHLQYPNTKFIKMYHPISSFLNFRTEASLKNIDYGYLDTLKVYGKYDGYAFTFKKDQTAYLKQTFSKMHQTYLAFLTSIELNNSDFIYKAELSFTENYFHTYDDPTLMEYYLRIKELIGETFDYDYAYIYEHTLFDSMLVNTFKEYQKVYVEYKEKFTMQNRSIKEIYDILSSINRCLVLVFILDLIENIEEANNKALIKAWMVIHYVDIMKALYMLTLFEKSN